MGQLVQAVARTILAQFEHGCSKIVKQLNADSKGEVFALKQEGIMADCSFSISVHNAERNAHRVVNKFTLEFRANQAQIAVQMNGYCNLTVDYAQQDNFVVMQRKTYVIDGASLGTEQAILAKALEYARDIRTCVQDWYAYSTEALPEHIPGMKLTWLNEVFMIPLRKTFDTTLSQIAVLRQQQGFEASEAQAEEQVITNSQGIVLGTRDVCYTVRVPFKTQQESVAADALTCYFFTRVSVTGSITPLGLRLQLQLNDARDEAGRVYTQHFDLGLADKSLHALAQDGRIPEFYAMCMTQWQQQMIVCA